MYKKTINPVIFLIALTMFIAGLLAIPNRIQAEKTPAPTPTCNFPADRMVTRGAVFSDTQLLSGFPKGYYYFTASYSGDLDITYPLITTLPKVFVNGFNGFFGTTSTMNTRFRVDKFGTPGESTDITISVHNEKGGIVCSGTFTVTLAKNGPKTQLRDTDNLNQSGDKGINLSHSVSSQ